MRKMVLVAVAVAAGVVGMIQIGEPPAAQEMKVTGKVTEADQQAKQITVGDKTFDMSDQTGTAMFPKVGAEGDPVLRRAGRQERSHADRTGAAVTLRRSVRAAIGLSRPPPRLSAAAVRRQGSGAFGRARKGRDGRRSSSGVCRASPRNGLDSGANV